MNEQRKNRRRKISEPEKDNSERWLLTYADMITLLLGLFIIMYSISTVDLRKLKNVASVIRGGFGLDSDGDSLVMDGSSGVIKDKDLVPKSIIYRLWERLAHTVKKIIVSDKVLVHLENNEELTLTIPASSLGEGKIRLPEESQEIFGKLAEVDKDIPLEIVVKVQIPYLEDADKERFYNNWAFTAYRASLIAKFISKKYKIPESRIYVQGISEFQKLSDSETIEERANQERVEILVRKMNRK
ncbi:MAG: endoflagellar motor protein [Leptospiraceae bacterium]|nr:endoflagellar motor protein [Leptospiraceae bacterium]